MNESLDFPTGVDARTPELIGVFDSGVGGLSILRALHQRLPRASWRPACERRH